MFEYLFTFQSLTAAQSARSVLNTEGIRAPVGRSARKLSVRLAQSAEQEPQSWLQDSLIFPSSPKCFVVKYSPFPSIPP